MFFIFIHSSIYNYTDMIIHNSTTSGAYTNNNNNNPHHIHNTNNILSNVKNNIPHIIWFIFDFSHAGAEYSSPNIDLSSKTGFELTQHYVSPICTAICSTLLTGIYSYKMGLQGVSMDYIHPSSIPHVPMKYKTIGSYLKTIGYNTKSYGKCHVGYAKVSYTPTHRVFGITLKLI